MFLPETASGRSGAWRSLRPVLAVPASARPTMRAVLPINTAQWALGGFFMSLGPSLVRQLVGPGQAWLGGLLIAVLVLSGAGAILWLRGHEPVLTMRRGAWMLVSGLVLAIVAIHIYFAARPDKWWGNRSMFTGDISRADYLARHDVERWKAKDV